MRNPTKLELYGVMPEFMRTELRKQIKLHNIGFVLLNKTSKKMHIIPAENYNKMAYPSTQGDKNNTFSRIPLRGIHIFGLEDSGVVTGNYYEYTED